MSGKRGIRRGPPSGSPGGLASLSRAGCSERVRGSPIRGHPSPRRRCIPARDGGIIPGLDRTACLRPLRSLLRLRGFTAASPR